MEHAKMEFKHINDWDGNKFSNKLTELSNLGWIVLSTQPNNGGGNGAILQRPVDYVSRRIVELNGAIKLMEKDVAENRYWYTNERHRPATLTEINNTKKAILKSREELELLQGEFNATK